MTFYSDVNFQDPLIQDKIYDLEDIYQSLHNLLNTRKGERLFLPDFGVDLEQFLFDPMTHGVQLQIYKEIFGAIEKYEPRITITNESGVFADPESHEIIILLIFTIKGLDPEKYVYQSRITPHQKEKFYGI